MKIYFYLLCLLFWATSGNCALESLLPQTDQCGQLDETFKPGNTYYFSYNLTKLHTSRDHTDSYLGILCDIELQAFPSCQYVLHTKNSKLNVEVDEPHEKTSSFSKQFEKYPVVFNGIGSITAHEKEDVALLNLKRGIISTIYTASVYLESGSKTIDKPDLHGHWNVSYELISKAIVRSIKTKDPAPVEEHCTSYFHESKELDYLTCVEHSVTTGKFVDVSRKLVLDHKSPLVGISANYLQNYRLTDLTYEKPNWASYNTDLRDNILKKIKDLVSFSVEPIQSESISTFILLVQDLKHTTDIGAIAKGFANCWGIQPCTKDSNTQTDNLKKLGHIWRDALVHCGNSECIKEFKNFVKQYSSSLPEVLSDHTMNDVYFIWLENDYSNPEIIENIYEICHFRNQSSCYLTVGAKIRKYWEKINDKTKISDKVRALVERPIEYLKHCKTDPDYKVLRVLKVLYNIGPFAEVIDANIVDRIYECAISPSVDWPISLAAIEALEKFEADKQVYQHLVDIIKNPSLSQKHHVVAYHILIDKYAEKAADDILLILRSNNTDGRFKTYIYSHIKAVLKAQDYFRKGLAKAFRKIVDDNPAEYFAYDSDHKIVSKYEEESLYFVPRFLPNIKNVYGIEDSFSFINDGSSFIPSSIIEKLKLIVEGQKIDVSTFAVYSKGLSEILTAMLEGVTKEKSNFIKGFYRYTFPQFLEKHTKELLSKVDKVVADKLQKIIKAVSPKNEGSLLIEQSYFGDEAWYNNAKYPPWNLQILNISSIPSSYRQYEQLFALKEKTAFTAGFPLKYVFDAEVVVDWAAHGSNEDKDNKVKRSFGLALSAAVGLHVGVVTELPGYQRFRNHFEAFGSGHINTELSVGQNISDVDLKTAWRLSSPPKSKQVITFQTGNVKVKDGVVEKTADDSLKSCTDLGRVHFCKTQSIDFSVPTGPNIHLEYELSNNDLLGLEHVEKVNSNRDADVSIKLIAGGEDVKDLFHVSLKRKDKKINQIKLTSDHLPVFDLEIAFENLDNENRSLKIESSLFFGFFLKYHYKEFSAKSGHLPSQATSYLKKHEVVKRNEDVHYTVETFEFVSPSWNFTGSSAQQQFPVSYYGDSSSYLHFLNANVAKQLAGTWPAALWQDSQTVGLEIHLEEDSFLGHLPLGVPEKDAQLVIKLPKYYIEAKYDKSILGDYSLFRSLNITTSNYPSDIKKHLSYKFSSKEKVSDEADHEKSLAIYTASVPHLLWRVTFETNKYTNDKYEFKSKAERFVNSKDNVHSVDNEAYAELDEAPPSHQKIYFNVLKDPTVTNSKKIIDINIGHKGFPWKDRHNTNLHFDIVSWPDPQTVNYILNLTDNRILYGNYRYYDHSTLENHWVLVDDHNKTVYDWKSDVFVNNAAKYLKYVEILDSDIFTYKGNLKWDWTGEYANIDLNVTQRCPVWDFLDVDLIQHISNGKEKTKFKHYWANINVEASWVDKYHSIVDISEGLFPSSRLKIDCESEHNCVGLLSSTAPARRYQDVHAYYELSSGATEASLRICDVNCDDLENPAVKLTTGLIDRHTSVVTQKISKHLNLANIYQAVALSIVYNFPKHSDEGLSALYKYFVGQSADETVEYLKTAAGHIVIILFVDGKATVGPVVTSLNKVFRSSQRHERAIEDIFIAELGAPDAKPYGSYLRTLTDIRESFVKRLGPVIGSTVYDVKYTLPRKNLTHIDFTLSHKILNYFINAKGDGDILYQNFHDENYTRVALLIGPNIVRPFEGGLVTIEGLNCPQLLTYDTDERSFIIYKKLNWIYFVFANTEIKLAYNTGEFIVNSEPAELPYTNYENDVHIEQQANRIILTTDHQLKVECDVASYYCIFYTNVWKFGKLYGLLGKNVDVVEAQLPSGVVKDSDKYILTEDHSCKIFRTQSNPLATDNKKCKEFFNLVTAFSTLAENDKIDPLPYYKECLTQQQNFGGPRSVINAYLSASAALDVPVDFDYTFDSQCDKHKLEDDWTDKFDEKKVDVVFIVDINLKSKLRKEYTKSLTSLATQIKQKFEQNGYNDIKFGLYGFGGDDGHHDVHEYTINHKDWGNAVSFSHDGLSHLFSEHESDIEKHSGKELLDAIDYVATASHFTNKAARFVILITSDDPYDHIKVDKLYDTLIALKSHQATFHTITYHDDWPETAFGISEKVYIPSKKPAKAPKGYGARLAKATHGLVWDLRFLEKDDNQKEFLNAVADALVKRAKEYPNENVHLTCELSPLLVAYPYVSP